MTNGTNEALDALRNADKTTARESGSRDAVDYLLSLDDEAATPPPENEAARLAKAIQADLGRLVGMLEGGQPDKAGEE